MLRTHYSSEITEELNGKRVKVAGWVQEVKDLGGIKFVWIRDREGIVQVTAPKKKVPPEIFKLIPKLNSEDVVVVEGIVNFTPKAKLGFEIIPEKFEVISRAQAPLPLDPTGKVKAELDTRLDNRFMDVRNPKVMAIFKIRSNVFRAVREFFYNEGFIEIHTPKIIATATEGGTELFPMKYFENDAFLAQSPQLYKQIMMATGLDKVFEVAPIFRAEEHNTTRHLNEAWSIDAEMAFIENEEEVMDLLERLVVYTIKYVRENNEKELKILEFELEEPKQPFPRITYDKALEILADLGKEIPWGEDIDTEGEKLLGRYIKENEEADLYFIYKYPSEAKPFYIMKYDDKPEICRAFDLEYRGIEISSGGQREHRHEILVEQIKEKGLNPESFEFYLRAFRYGMPPHGGFGLGAERLIMRMLDIGNIREVILFPRDRRRLVP
ncbi:aspartate--tRNA(Asn) ligase [Thermococcus chitonophagus]|uniref:Aspartate--tRNA(Asp) ligase n=1 Tax=Thermococcus chitonophagus TaxID=54262 RepID=A0A160VSW1_9EURY|nr:aspartate--tRNA(Asn) ligase [Thermococcus chitonophagus]ASJ17171.1 aspartate--tRNA(Asn) ligase [Thermococcus chitonophagus]CUX77779.1 Aspartyl-tRNA synthetase [Thermococcus chitonophagus]